MTDGQKSAIKDAFKTKESIKTMKIENLRKKLVDLKFNETEVKNLSESDARKTATTLADTAGVPA